MFKRDLIVPRIAFSKVENVENMIPCYPISMRAVQILGFSNHTILEPVNYNI